MDKVPVYRYETYDRARKTYVRQPHFATWSTIVALNGIVMESSSRDVPAAEVSSRGIWEAPERDRGEDGQLA